MHLALPILRAALVVSILAAAPSALLAQAPPGTDTDVGRTAGRPRSCDADLDLYASEPDAALRLEKLLDMGWMCWVDFDGHEGRAFSAHENPPKPDLRSIPKDGAPRSVTDAAGRLLADAVDQCRGEPLSIAPIMAAAIDSITMTLAPMPFELAGEADYLRAKRLFEAAYELNPTDRRTYWRLAMVLAARDNWTELRVLARNQTRITPGDAWAWMTLALGAYRLQPGKEARALFDSALALFEPNERERLDHLERVMRPADTARFQFESAANRERIVQTSWVLADPLWTTQPTDPRMEFLARVAYAELRWTLEGWNTHGADTPRGDIYVRYGPPSTVLGSVVTTEPDSSVSTSTMHLFWIYNSRLVFSFDKSLHVGMTRANSCDYDLVERMKAWQPARWDNIATTLIDSMPTQVARFRAGNDSVDMYLAARASLVAMRSLPVGHAGPRAHFWLYSRGTGDAFADSTAVGSSGVLQWTRRLQSGPYNYRVESMIPGAIVAGRTTADVMVGPDPVTGFATSGFGLSDLLVATRAKARVAARRWNDIDVTPVLGDIAKDGGIALVWENYELGAQGTDARYEVAVTIEREVAKSGRIDAQITGLRERVAVTSSKDKVAMRFERRVSHAPVVTENVTIALGATPPGTYRLSVQVTDIVSGRSATRATRIAIRDR